MVANTSHERMSNWTFTGAEGRRNPSTISGNMPAVFVCHIKDEQAIGESGTMDSSRSSTRRTIAAGVLFS
ncbi:MAG: hypothetical protein ACLS37_12720 [Alistipes sp.]